MNAGRDAGVIEDPEVEYKAVGMGARYDAAGDVYVVAYYNTVKGQSYRKQFTYASKAIAFMEQLKNYETCELRDPDAPSYGEDF